VIKNTLNHNIFIFLCAFAGLLCGLVMFTRTGFGQQGKAGDPAYVFYKGNTLYEEENYDGAIDEYTKLLDRGLESGNLYYNIGNCYFKKGELGKAILNYERAKRLIPRDSDLKSNYTFALSRIQLNITPKLSWIRRVSDLFHFLSLNELTVLVSSAFVLAVLFLVLRLFLRGLRKYTLAVISCLTMAIVLLSVPLAERIALLDKEAVVIAEKPEVKFEPLDDATTFFTLYEGMKITTIQSDKEWAKIRRADGKVGWIRRKDIEKI
jgi:tetratricopeptide (TPR) repeat protein